MYTNQKIFVEALLKQGASVVEIDPQRELLKVAKGSKQDLIFDRTSSVVSHVAMQVTADKFLTKKILVDKNISCPEGQIFDGFLWAEAVQWSKDKYPLVLKPNWGSHGDDIVVDIRDAQELNKAIHHFVDKHGFKALYILERCYKWPEYRLFITKNGDFAAVERQWAGVVGDGVSSIEQLISKENNRRAVLKQSTKTSLCPIVMDEESKTCLSKQGYCYQSVLDNNQRIFLRYQSNLAKGGRAIDATHKMSKFKSLAIEVLGCFEGLPVAGIDVLCQNPEEENCSYFVLEVNSNPGLSMHRYPAEGQSQDVGAYLAKVMVPWVFE